MTQCSLRQHCDARGHVIRTQHEPTRSRSYQTSLFSVDCRRSGYRFDPCTEKSNTRNSASAQFVSEMLLFAVDFTGSSALSCPPDPTPRCAPLFAPCTLKPRPSIVYRRSWTEPRP
eukprot:2610506-Rhodomonas_salina.3